MDLGILVAADKNQEWLLPSWHHSYLEHNDYPVTFVDLGLTKEARDWCKEKGKILQPRIHYPSCTKESVPSKQREQWERLLGAYIWSVRPTWFLKPFLLPLSPFEATIWLDLDCQIRGSLETIFQVLRFGIQIAIARESESVQHRDRKEGLLLDGEVSYNTGVIGYVKNAPFLTLSTQKVYSSQNEFISDQNLISRVLFENSIPIFELPRTFNWSLCDGINENAIVHHYCGAYWKMALLKMLKPDLGDNPVLPPPFEIGLTFS